MGDLSETNLLNLKFLRLKRLDKASRLARRPVANVIKLFKAISYALSGAPLKGRLLASPTNIRQDRKSLPGTNALAY